MSSISNHGVTFFDFQEKLVKVNLVNSTTGGTDLKLISGPVQKRELMLLSASEIIDYLIEAVDYIDANEEDWESIKKSSSIDVVNKMLLGHFDGIKEKLKNLFIKVNVGQIKIAFIKNKSSLFFDEFKLFEIDNKMSFKNAIKELKSNLIKISKSFKNDALKSQKSKHSVFANLSVQRQYQKDIDGYSVKIESMESLSRGSFIFHGNFDEINTELCLDDSNWEIDSYSDVYEDSWEVNEIENLKIEKNDRHFIDVLTRSFYNDSSLTTKQQDELSDEYDDIDVEKLARSLEWKFIVKTEISEIFEIY